MSRGALGLVLALLGLANIISVLSATPWAMAALGEQTMDLDRLGWGRADIVMLSVLLIFVARALAQGKRQAWWLSTALVAFSMLDAVLSHRRLPTLHLSLTLLLVLLVLAPLWWRRSDPHAVARGYLALAIAVCCLVFLRQLNLPSQVGTWPGPPPRWAASLVLRAGVMLAVMYGVVTVLRPVRAARQLAYEEHARALTIAQRYGAATTAHFAAGADKRYFWSDTGQSFIGFRLMRGVALMLGDPIGPEDESVESLGAFIEYCAKQDWIFACYLASPRVRQWCREWGMMSCTVGEEAIVDVSRFTIVGHLGAPVRHAIARATKDGVGVTCWQGEDLPDALFAEVRGISRAWQGAHQVTVQMGFSMGRFPEDWSSELLTAVARDRDGAVQAFLTWTPLYQGGGWALDVMRRSPTAVPGTTEMLIAESIAWAKAHGYRTMSLGLAPLAGIGGDDDVGHRLETDSRRGVLDRVAGTLHQRKLLLGTYASLYRFKAKFQPSWEPRYLVMQDLGALPRTLSALMCALGYTWTSMVREAVGGILPPHREQDAG